MRCRTFLVSIVLVIVMALSALMILTLTGCKNKEKDDAIGPVAVSTPLALDPTEQHEFEGWWASGESMLWLGEDGTYKLFKGGNRYQKPAERGNWHKESYAVIRLYPYSQRLQPPVRVSIQKIEGDVALRIGQAPTSPALQRVDQPPVVDEDRLVGKWSGPMGTLELRPNMRYVFSPVRGDKPVQLAGHQGTWRLETGDKGGAVKLQPSTPGVNPVELKMEGEEDATALRWADSQLRRVEPEGEET